MPTTTRLRGKLRLNDTAAVHKLPNELLAEVMRTGFHQYKVQDYKRINYYLSTISSVCAIWRRVALGLPFLWTNIAYDSSTHHQHTSSTRHHHLLKRSLDRMETYLLRSKNLPLNVVLDFSEEGKVNARRIMKVIIPHTGRFRFWQLTIGTKEISKLMLPLRGPLDRLETLVLYLNFTNPDNISNNNNNENDDETPMRSTEQELMLEGVTSPLRELHITGLAGCKLGNVPAKALTALHINSVCMSTVEMARLLSHCQAAVDVNVVSLGDGETLDGVAPFSLPSAETLTIVDTLPPTFPAVIDAANLRELTIVSFAFNPDIWASSSSSLTTPPTWPRLQRLSLRGLWIAPDAVRPLLRANPSIKHINMSHCREIVLLALTLFIVKSPLSNEFVDASDTIVPVLEKLQIELSTGHTDNGSLGKLLLGVMTRRPNLRVECDMESWEGSQWSWLRVREQTNSRLKLTRSYCEDFPSYFCPRGWKLN